MSTTEYITLTELSELTNRSVEYLTRLIAQGRLPAGHKTWKVRRLPKIEALTALAAIPRREKGRTTG